MAVCPSLGPADGAPRRTLEPATSRSYPETGSIPARSRVLRSPVLAHVAGLHEWRPAASSPEGTPWVTSGPRPMPREQPRHARQPPLDRASRQARHAVFEPRHVVATTWLPLVGDEPQHISRGDQPGLLGHHPEKHRQVATGREQPVRAGRAATNRRWSSSSRCVSPTDRAPSPLVVRANLSAAPADALLALPARVGLGHRSEVRSACRAYRRECLVVTGSEFVGVLGQFELVRLRLCPPMFETAASMRSVWGRHLRTPGRELPLRTTCRNVRAFSSTEREGIETWKRPDRGIPLGA